jgi:carbonic anhydrase/acetyltransferase-like protein (isoleucine patch superfamily)
VTGGRLKIRRDEVVHDVSVFGGSVEVYGTVTGDLAVMGGRAEVHPGAHIVGSATTVGGSLRVHDGARVDGDVGVLGGSLERDDKAQVGGSVVQPTPQDDDDDHSAHRSGDHHEGLFSRAWKAAGDAFSHAAILFVFGTIVIALGSKHLEKLRVEVAARPMRSFALGFVGLIGAVALVTALCVTIVGIPVAIVGVLVGAVAVYVGVVAVVTTLGEGLLRHRTENPYVHLAVGCAILFVVGAIPYVGSFAEAFVALVGVGVLVATRAAGLVPAARARPSQTVSAL